MRVLNIREAALIANKSERRIRQLCQSKEIKAQKLFQGISWIIREKDLLKYLNNQSKSNA